jgi:hypothetical protein
MEPMEYVAIAAVIVTALVAVAVHVCPRRR